MNVQNDPGGISPEASRLRQYLVQTQIERIEMVYVDAKAKWGEPPVILVMDPRDSCAAEVCRGLRKWLPEEMVEQVLRDAEERNERPIIIQAVPIENAIDPAFVSDEIHFFIGEHIEDTLCVIAIAEEGKTLVGRPVPEE